MISEAKKADILQLLIEHITATLQGDFKYVDLALRNHIIDINPAGRGNVPGFCVDKINLVGIGEKITKIFAEDLQCRIHDGSPIHHQSQKALIGLMLWLVYYTCFSEMAFGEFIVLVIGKAVEGCTEIKFPNRVIEIHNAALTMVAAYAEDKEETILLKSFTDCRKSLHNLAIKAGATEEAIVSKMHSSGFKDQQKTQLIEKTNMFPSLESVKAETKTSKEHIVKVGRKYLQSVFESNKGGILTSARTDAFKFSSESDATIFKNLASSHPNFEGINLSVEPY